MTTVEIPVSRFKLIMYDGPKRDMGPNRCNAGYFGKYHEGKHEFTLPVGHHVGDYAVSDEITDFYCRSRGTVENGKFRFDSGNWSYMNEFYGKALSTLVVDNGVATVNNLIHAPTECDYAISGYPIIRRGAAVPKSYAYEQGWGDGSTYKTSHVFLCLDKPKADTIHLVGLNASAETAKKKLNDFYDVIKLDGGGSFYMDVNGKKKSTAGFRRVFSVIDFSGSCNAYPIPTRTLKKGCRGEDVKWLQQNLLDIGYLCEVDGKFGSITQSFVMSYQRMNGLDPDGKVGKATRASFLNK